MKRTASPAILIFLFLILGPANQLKAVPWQARHGLSPTAYQQTFNEMKRQGFRPVCVNGYTENGKELYQALWQKPASSPAWDARHGLSAAAFQSTFDDLFKKGYRLTWISGYAVNGQPKFAAIWEKKSGPAWQARHNMTAAVYQTTFNDMKKKGYRLQQVCGYAVGSTPYFAAIWDKASGGAWEARHNMSAAKYRSTFNDLDAKGYVLKCVSGYHANGADQYEAIWEKKSSPLWWTRHGIAAMNYQHVFDNMFYQGYYPVFLTAYASGSTSRYNVIWNNVAMKWSDIKTIDKAAQDYMKDQGVGGLSLAVCRQGRLVFAKSYGYANKSTGEELCPSHSMRIMSISKPVTSCGLMKLYMQNQNVPDRKVFGQGSILGGDFSTPAGQEKLNDITVRELLSHTSGLRTCNGESVFWDKTKTKADAMNVLLNAGDLLQSDPNTQYNYSNANFFILSMIIEKLSGQSYETFIRQNLLTPAGIGNTMYVGAANGSSGGGEVSYTPAKAMNLQLWAGFGGWVARPMDLLKLLNRVDGETLPSDNLSANAHAQMTTGTSLNMGYGLGWLLSGNQQSHNGCYDGTRSFLVELPNHLSYAVIINENPNNDGCGWTMKSAIETGLNAVSAWPAYDLF